MTITRVNLSDTVTEISSQVWYILVRNCCVFTIIPLLQTTDFKIKIILARNGFP